MGPEAEIACLSKLWRLLSLGLDYLASIYKRCVRQHIVLVALRKNLVGLNPPFQHNLGIVGLKAVLLLGLGRVTLTDLYNLVSW